MQQQQSNQPQHSTDFVSSLKQWWQDCPLFTRFLFLSCTALCLSFFFTLKTIRLLNMPYKTVGDFELGRLIFSPFVHKTILQLAFALLTYLPVSAEQEKENGTLKTMIDFFIKTVEIGLVFIALLYVLSHFDKALWLSRASYGLWNILFYSIFERCLLNPDGTTSFILPTIRLPNKYYPIVIYAAVSIITEVFRIDLLAAGITVIINLKFFSATFDEKLSPERVASWEPQGLKSLPNYVSFAGSSSAAPLLSQQEREYNNNANVNGATTSQRRASTGSPSRSKGNLYGESEINLGEMKPANKKNGFEIDV